MSPRVNMSSEPTVLNYMPLVVSSEFGKSAQFIIPVKKTISIYIYLNAKVSQQFNIRILFSMVHVRIFLILQSYFCSYTMRKIYRKSVLIMHFIQTF